MLHHRMRAASGVLGGIDITPKSAWLFNENIGTSTADEYGSNTGTLTSSSLWTPNGIVGSAIQGTGTTSHFINLPSGANIAGLSTSNTIFGFVCWFFVSSITDVNTILMLNKQSSGTNSDNRGGYFVINASGEVVFTVREGISTGFGGQPNGNWGTGLSVSSGWNMIICNRSQTTAECVVRNSTGRSSNTMTGSYGNMLFNNTARGNRVGSYISNLFTLQSGNRIDSLAIYDTFIDSSAEEYLWNSGISQEP